MNTTACIKGWRFSSDPLAWGWVGNRGAFRQKSSFLVRGTEVVVFLGLCVLSELLSATVDPRGGSGRGCGGRRARPRARLLLLGGKEGACRDEASRLHWLMRAG